MEGSARFGRPEVTFCRVVCPFCEKEQDATRGPWTHERPDGSGCVMISPAGSVCLSWHYRIRDGKRRKCEGSGRLAAPTRFAGS